MKITMQNNINKTIQEAFDEFQKFNLIKNLSEYTIVYYDRCFDRLSGFIDVSKPTNTITQELIQDYTLHLQNDDAINDISTNTILRGTRAILYYFMKLGYCDNFKIKLIKTEKPIKETYTDAELELLLKKPDMKTCRFTEYRNWVLVNYLLGSGNRISTTQNLKIGDLDFDNRVIKMRHTKNRRQQLIPMSNTLAEILIEYLQYRGGNDDDYVFCTQWGTQLQLDSIKQAVKSHNQSRGVMKTSSHAFRHTFAKKWILAGGDMFRLQKILGHSSLDVVKEYVNMFDEDLKKDFECFNPLDQMTQQKKEVIRMRK